mgnify:CR=1 FL=1
MIGGGAGLSAAAGLVYSGRRFAENFAPFIQKYHLSDMYSAGFYPFDTEEEKWAYWAKHILLNRYGAPAPLYRQLYQLVQDKNYFVITTNVDAQFQKSGFSPNRIFAVQGDYGLLQCATGCHDTLYENETLVKQMIAQFQRILYQYAPYVAAGWMCISGATHTLCRTGPGIWQMTTLRGLLPGWRGKRLFCWNLALGFIRLSSFDTHLNRLPSKISRLF